VRAGTGGILVVLIAGVLGMLLVRVPARAAATVESAV
jgi:hypothetical protein